MTRALLSVIWIDVNGDPPKEYRRFSDWMARQSCSACLEAVVWERNAGRASFLSDPSTQWDAPDGAALLTTLSTPYICLAGNDLLQQKETYLEENLMSIRAGALAFTVNIRGRADWAMAKIRAGWWPGSPDSPLLRQVVRRDCLNGGLTLDLSSWIQARKGFSTIAGRVLRHTTSFVDLPEELPFVCSGIGRDAETRIEGMDILVRSRSPKEWGAPLARVHPFETVVPELRYPADRPILIMLHTYLAVGGAERIHLNLMRELQDKMHFIVVGIEPLDAALGTTADEFRQLTPYVYSLPDFLPHSANLSFLCGLITQCRPSALYIANGANFIYDNLPELKHRFPFLRTVNQVYDHKIGWINRYSPAVAASLNAHIGVNRKICRAYIEKGALPEEVHLIENGIISGEFDVSRYNPAIIASLKKSLHLPQDRKIITFAARIHPQKRPLDFVELAAHFMDDPSVIFLMIGDGPLSEEVSRAITDRGIVNLHRRPFYRPMSDIYAISDVFVLPSEFEGMPMAVIEAQAMGKPVVVTDVGNNREVVESTDGGVVVPEVGDIRALSDGVRSMLLHPSDPRRLRNSVLAKYDISIVAEKYRQVFLNDAMLHAPQ